MTTTEIYVEQLSGLVEALDMASLTGAPVVTKAFFGGAALYVDGAIVASLSSVGLAFKLGEAAAAVLIAGGAEPLRYVPGGHVKRGYALFADPDLASVERWRPLLTGALEHASDRRAR